MIALAAIFILGILAVIGGGAIISKFIVIVFGLVMTLLAMSITFLALIFSFFVMMLTFAVVIVSVLVSGLLSLLIF